MTLELIRTEHGLVPIDDESVEAIKKLKLRDVIIVEWKPKRNVRFHRKLFSMIRAVLPNQEQYKSENELLDVIKVESGHCTTLFTPSGIEVKVPDSIAFHAMDEAEFERFYNSANMVCCQLVGEEALDEILRYI